MTDWALQALVQAPNLIGVGGVILAGKRRRSGWALGFASEIAWAVWAWRADAPGVYPWCIIWGVFYARNWLKWSRP